MGELETALGRSGRDLWRFCVRGSPFAMRLVTGLLKPKYGVPGFDLAGLVDAVGNRVTQFKPGDAMFGAGNGNCAE